MVRVTPYPLRPKEERVYWEVALEKGKQRNFGDPLIERGEWYFVQNKE